MTWRPQWEESPRGAFGFGGGMRSWGVAKTLVGACVVVTLIAMIGAGRQGDVPIARWLGLWTGNAAWVYPWFTYVLVHDTDQISHIVVNGVMLWFLGVELEQRLGRGRFVTLFFGSALVGAAAHVGLQLAGGYSPGLLIGASGGIFGLLFFIARETPRRPFFFWLVPVPALLLAILYVILELHPLLRGGLGADNVAHLCHLGGAAFGWWYCGHPFNALASYERVKAEALQASTKRVARQAADDDVEMDRILRKIHEQGIPSLSEAEKRFLDERSKALRGGRR